MIVRIEKCVGFGVAKVLKVPKVESCVFQTV